MRLAHPMLMAVILATGTAAAQGVHKDTRLGFSFKPPKDYQAIALEPSEKTTVARYQDPSTDLGGEQGSQKFNRTFEVDFISMARVRQDERGENTTGTDGKPREKGTRTVEEWWEEMLDKRFGSPDVERDKPLTLAGASGHELWLAFKNEPIKMYVAVVPQDDGIFLLRGRSIADRFEKASQDFAKAAKSFKRIGKEDDSARQAALSQMDDQERFLEEQIDKLPPGWSSLRSARYLFLYDTDKAFAQELADRIEGMRDVYEKDYPPSAPITAVSIVRVCASVDEYYGYGGPQGTGGYWNWVERELVIFDFRPRELTLAVLNHEGFHQYIFYYCGQLSPHSWYNEGTGDYYAGAKLTRTNRITGFGDAPGGIGRRDTIREAARLMSEGKSGAEGACPPLRKVMRFHQKDYYGSSGYDPGICYAQGWGIIHFLRQGKLEPKWQKLLTDYMAALLQARSDEAADMMEHDHATAEKVEAGSSAALSDDPKDWYDKVDSDAVQDRAFDATFKDWTDADWERFQAAWLKYIEKI